MKRLVATVMVSVALLFASACSSSGDDGKSAYVDAAMRTYDKDAEAGQLGVTRKQAQCIIGKIIDAIGLDKIKKQGFTPNSFENGSSTSQLITDLGETKLAALDRQCGIKPATG